MEEASAKAASTADEAKAEAASTAKVAMEEAASTTEQGETSNHYALGAGLGEEAAAAAQRE